MQMLRLKEKTRIGSEARYSDADIYWALVLLSRGKRMGRRELSDEMGIGEGSIRSVMSILKESRLVEVYQTGAVITELGTALLERIPVIPVSVMVPGSVVGDCHWSVVVKGASEKIRVGREQRDAGIRAGALGCTTIVYRKGELMIPPDWVLDDKSPESAAEIRAIPFMEEDDAIIIGSAESVRDAVNAAVNAAFELL